jgi:hypothetical protein
MLSDARLGILENDVVVLLGAEDVGAARGRRFFVGCVVGPLLFGLLRLDLCVCGCRVALLLSGDLLQAVELFSVEFVELGIDVWEG